MPTPHSQLHRSLRLINYGACFFMVFMTGVSSPLVIKLLENHGATPLQVGLYGAISLMALSMQFIGALLARRMRSRKPAFMTWVIIGRLLYLPALLLPALHPGLQGPLGITWMIACLFVANLLNHMATPLFFSWMGDLIPSRVLSRFWGLRTAWSSGVWVICYLLIMSLSRVSSFSFTPLFVTIVWVSVMAGVFDILLFKWVDEPPQKPFPPAHPLNILLQPLRDPGYRSLVLFFGAWHATAVCAAVQMGYYLFAAMHLPVWQATLIWALQGLGTAVSSKGWGQLAQRRGSIFLLRTGMGFKILIAVAFLLITPDTAFWVLIPVCFLDGMWNAAYGIGQNSLMFSRSPDQDRAMFVAAMTGFCGLFGALSAILGGSLIQGLTNTTLPSPWGPLSNFQILFLISALLRVGMAIWAWRLEPDLPRRNDPWVTDLLGVWPFRAFHYPVGLDQNWKQPKP